MILESLNVGPMQVNCYILACDPAKSAIIIDPGGDADKIKQILNKHKLKPAMIINTHGHYDHIGADDQFETQVYVHRDDREMLLDPGLNLSGLFSVPYKVISEINLIEDKQVLSLDCLELEVIHLPGHTRGGVGLVMKKPQANIIFTGDTLFFSGIGRYDLPGGSKKTLEKSIKERLFVLPEETIVYPGHGESTTIGREKLNEFF